MHSIAEILPGMAREPEEKTIKKETTLKALKMDCLVHDEAWIKAQKRTIRNGGSKRSNDLLQIPKRFIGKSLADFEAPEDFKRGAYDNFVHKNLFLCGLCGTGKSHLSCGLLLKFYSDRAEYDPESRSWKRPRGRFISVQEFLFELKSALASNQSDFARIKSILELDAFVLDDFGASRMTDYAVEMMSVLINEIYLHKLSGVIITSNLSLDDIGQKIDDRTASRIVEMCEVIKLNGADRRIREK
jgi:DNA replication protein DnaC